MSAKADKAPRLFVEARLAAGEAVELPREAVHYLVNVMRRRAGDPVVLFNGRDGEWQAALAEAGRRQATAVPETLLRRQPVPPDLHYCFAPLKRARVDYIAQKATELGASRLVPVLTHHTNAERVNVARLHANAIEAAEQCGIAWVPEVGEPLTFDHFLAGREHGRRLVFCDEAAPVADPVSALSQVSPGPLAVLIGPEGGFSESERQALLSAPGVVAISLGPRVMRADTAGVAALALVQAVLGDWRDASCGAK